MKDLTPITYKQLDKKGITPSGLPQALLYFAPKDKEAPYRCSASLFSTWTAYRQNCDKQKHKLRGCLCNK